MMQRKIVLVNQHSGYLFLDVVNAFAKEYDQVVLMAGKVVTMDDPLDPKVTVQKIFPYNRASTFKRFMSWIVCVVNIWWLLLTKYRQHDLLLSSNPPVASTLIPLLFRRRTSLLLYDVYPDGLVATGFVGVKNPIFKVWAWFNKCAYRKVDRIITLTDGMATTIQQYCPKEKITVVPAWSNVPTVEHSATKEENPFVEAYGLQNKWIVMYSGNFGKGYHLEPLVKVAENFRGYPDIVFILVGEGWQKELLSSRIESHGLSNCKILPYQPSAFFLHSLQACHVGVVSLTESLENVAIPSKTYNLLAVGHPIFCIGSVTSALARFLEKHEVGMTCDPTDTESMTRFIERLYVDKEYYRRLSDNALIVAKSHTKHRARDILELVAAGAQNRP
jgi:glycosyltransferase involved in cell wall biosynthesis